MKLYHTGGRSSVFFWAGQAYLPISDDIPEDVAEVFWRSRSGASAGVRLKKGVVVDSFRTDAWTDDIWVLVPYVGGEKFVGLYNYQAEKVNAILKVRCPSSTEVETELVWPQAPWDRVEREYRLWKGGEFVEYKVKVHPVNLTGLPEFTWAAALCDRIPDDVVWLSGSWFLHDDELCRMYRGRTVEYFRPVNTPDKYKDKLVWINRGESFIFRHILHGNFSVAYHHIKEEAGSLELKGGYKFEIHSGRLIYYNDRPDEQLVKAITEDAGVAVKEIVPWQGTCYHGTIPDA